MTLKDFVLSKLRTLKTWLDKCLKSFVSEDLSTSNMINGPKHCWNLHDSTFNMFTDQCQGDWVGASLSYWHAKCNDYRSYNDTSSDAIIHETKKIFKTFCCNFEICIKFWTFWKKTITLIDFVCQELWTPKTRLTKCPKRQVSEVPSTSNKLKGPKTCSNLYHSTFIICIDQGNWVGKILSYCRAKSWKCLLTHWQPMASNLFLIGSI